MKLIHLNQNTNRHSTRLTLFSLSTADMGGDFEPVLARLSTIFTAYDPWVNWYPNKRNGGVLLKDASQLDCIGINGLRCIM